MHWFIYYGLQLLICYFGNRFIYKRDKSYPIGWGTFYMLIPFIGLLNSLGCMAILIAGESDKNFWDIIYGIKRK